MQVQVLSHSLQRRVEQWLVRESHKLKIGGSIPSPANSAPVVLMVDQMSCKHHVRGSNPLRS